MMIRGANSALLVLGCLVAHSVAQSTSIIAEGASFPESVYASAVYSYPLVEPGVSVSYTASGSGAGQRRLLAGEVHWAGTDSPFSISNILARPDIRLFPALAGSVVPVVNLDLTYRSSYTGTDPAPRSSLVLSRQTIAKIFDGSVTRWDDSELQSDNPHLIMPALPITVVTRLERSGTTELFTGSLASFSANFASVVGETSRTDRWPNASYAAHAQASGNSGMAATVKLTPNSIGYAVLEAATSAESQIARMRNRAGSIVEASAASTAFALMELGGSRNATTGTTNLADAFSSSAWPICGYTYVAVSSTMMRGTCEERAATVNFLRWLLTSETVRLAASKLGFAVLPDFLRDRVVTELTSFVECANGVRAVSSQSGTSVVIGVPSQIAGSWTLLEAAYTASSTSALGDGSVAQFTLSPSSGHLEGFGQAMTDLALPEASPSRIDAAVHTDPSKTPEDFAVVSTAVRAARTDPNLSELGVTYAASPSLVTVPFTLMALGVGANLPGVRAAAESAGLAAEIRMTTTILSRVFSGSITSWSDTALVNANSHSPELQAALRAAGSITIAQPSGGDSIIAAFTWALTSADQTALSSLEQAVASGSPTIVSAVSGQYMSVSQYPTTGTVRSVEGVAGVEAALRVVTGAVGVVPAESLHGVSIALTSSDGTVLRAVAEDTSACLSIRPESVTAKTSCWPLTIPLYMSVHRSTLSSRLLRSLQSGSFALPQDEAMSGMVPKMLPSGSLHDLGSLRRGLQTSLVTSASNLTDVCQRVRFALLAATWLVGNGEAASALEQMEMEPLRGDSARGAQYALSEGARCGGAAVLSLRAQCEVGQDRVSDITCVDCPRGTTNTVAGTECGVCPEEAVCAGGAHFAVAEDFWEGENRKIYRCNLFACCPQGNCTLDGDDRCANGRVGDLCGWCPDGQSLASQAGGCVDCTDVNWGSVAITAVIQMLFVAYLVYSARDDVKNAAVLLVLEFFQLAQLAMNPYREELSFSLELGWLNLRLNPPGSVDCVFPMSPLAFLASPLYVPLFVSFVLLVYTLLFSVAYVCRRCKFDIDTNTLWRFQQAGWGTLFVVLAATVQVGLEIMTCREVEGVMVNAAVPAVQCSGAGYYTLAVFSGAAAIGFLAIVPFAVYRSNGHYLVLMSRYKSAFRILAAIKSIVHLQRRVRKRQNEYRAARGLAPIPEVSVRPPRDPGTPMLTSVKFKLPESWGVGKSSDPDPAALGRATSTVEAVASGLETVIGGALATIGLGDLVKPKPRVHYDLTSIGWSKLPLVVRGNAPLFRPYAGAMAQSFHAFFLLRRSISVVITTFLVSDPHAKQIVLLFWLLTALLVSLATKPFRDFLDNLLNTFSLTVLCLIAALELHYVSFVSDKPQRVSYIQLALIILFVLCVPFVFVSRYLLDLRHEAVEKAVKEGKEIPAPAKSCAARTHTRVVSFCRRVCANNIQGHSIFDDSQYDSDDVTELRRKQLLYAKMRERDRLAAEHDRMAAAGIATTRDAVQAARAAAGGHTAGASAASAGHPALASKTGHAASGSRVVKW